MDHDEERTIQNDALTAANQLYANLRELATLEARAGNDALSEYLVLRSHDVDELIRFMEAWRSPPIRKI